MRVNISEYPASKAPEGLAQFLNDPVKPLSERASRGFLKRAMTGKLKFKDGFLSAVKRHADEMAIISEKSASLKVA